MVLDKIENLRLTLTERSGKPNYKIENNNNEVLFATTNIDMAYSYIYKTIKKE
jgi:hypothetical protein